MAHGLPQLTVGRPCMKAANHASEPGGKACGLGLEPCQRGAARHRMAGIRDEDDGLHDPLSSRSFRSAGITSWAS